MNQTISESEPQYEYVANLLGFEFHEGSDKAQEIKVVKSILIRESILAKLTDYMRKETEKDTEIILNLLTQIREITLTVLENVGLWRRSFSLSHINHPTSTIPFIWRNENIILKMKQDLNFLVHYDELVNNIGLRPNLLTNNPLMLPTTLDENLSTSDPVFLAYFDAGGKKDGPIFDARLRLRLAEQILKNEPNTNILTSSYIAPTKKQTEGKNINLLSNIDDQKSKADTGEIQHLQTKSTPTDSFKLRAGFETHPKYSKYHDKSASLTPHSWKSHVVSLSTINTNGTTTNASSVVTSSIHPICSDDLHALTKIQAPVSQRLALASTCLLLLLYQGIEPPSDTSWKAFATMIRCGTLEADLTSLSHSTIPKFKAKLVKPLIAGLSNPHEVKKFNEDPQIPLDEKFATNHLAAFILKMVRLATCRASSPPKSAPSTLRGFTTREYLSQPSLTRVYTARHNLHRNDIPALSDKPQLGHEKDIIFQPMSFGVEFQLFPFYTEMLQDVYKHSVIVTLLSRFRFDQVKKGVDLSAYDTVTIRVYDPTDSIENSLIAKIGEYFHHFKELAKSINPDEIANFYQPHKHYWWAENIQRILIVQQKIRKPITLTLRISKKKIEKCIINSVEQHSHEASISSSRNSLELTIVPEICKAEILDLHVSTGGNIDENLQKSSSQTSFMPEILPKSPYVRPLTMQEKFLKALNVKSKSRQASFRRSASSTFKRQGSNDSDFTVSTEKSVPCASTATTDTAETCSNNDQCESEYPISVIESNEYDDISNCEKENDEDDMKLENGDNPIDSQSMMSSLSEWGTTAAGYSIEELTLEVDVPSPRPIFEPEIPPVTFEAFLRRISAAPSLYVSDRNEAHVDEVVASIVSRNLGTNNIQYENEPVDSFNIITRENDNQKPPSAIDSFETIPKLRNETEPQIAIGSYEITAHEFNEMEPLTAFNYVEITTRGCNEEQPQFAIDSVEQLTDDSNKNYPLTAIDSDKTYDCTKEIILPTMDITTCKCNLEAPHSVSTSTVQKVDSARSSVLGFLFQPVNVSLPYSESADRAKSTTPRPDLCTNTINNAQRPMLGCNISSFNSVTLLPVLEDNILTCETKSGKINQDSATSADLVPVSNIVTDSKDVTAITASPAPVSNKLPTATFELAKAPVEIEPQNCSLQKVTIPIKVSPRSDVNEDTELDDVDICTDEIIDEVFLAIQKDIPGSRLLWSSKIRPRTCNEEDLSTKANVVRLDVAESVDHHHQKSHVHREKSTLIIQKTFRQHRSRKNKFTTPKHIADSDAQPAVQSVVKEDIHVTGCSDESFELPSEDLTI